MAVDPAAHQRLIQSYIPFTLAERRDRLRMLGLAESGHSAFSRTNFSPGHFTASAFVLSPDRSSLLLILHKKLGKWLQPGGHVEPEDMDLAMAAVREVYEETGLHPTQLQMVRDGVFDVDIHRIPAHGEEPEHEHFDIRFLMQANTDEVASTNDVDAVRWVRLEDIQALGGDGSITRIVQRLSTPLSSFPSAANDGP